MRTFVTRRGDTLSGIARLLGVDWHVLARVNHIADPARLRVGMRLRVPGTRDREHAAPSPSHPVAAPAPGSFPPAPERSAGAAPPHLGDLSMVHETGFTPGHELQASARVSTGVSDPGGVSYGAYQLNSAAAHGAVVLTFLRHEGARWAIEFAGEDPTVADGDFDRTWKTIAARDGMTFFDAQHLFIARSHYLPVVEAVKQKTGFDIATRCLTLQNVVWSMAVQHGRAKHLVLEGVEAIGLGRPLPDLRQRAGDPAPLLPGSGAGTDTLYRTELWAIENERLDRQLVIKLYEIRTAYVIANHQPRLRDRYVQEQREALQQMGDP